MARIKSKLSKSAVLTGRATESTRMPCLPATRRARGSAGTHGWHEGEPAESTWKRRSSPSAFARWVKTAAARGERQMFPEHTNRMRVVLRGESVAIVRDRTRFVRDASRRVYCRRLQAAPSGAAMR